MSPPRMPESLERHWETSAGRIRTRTVGRASPGVPEVVVVQGMVVADYLMPALAELGRWTRAHLVELPGYAGSGEPSRRLDVSGYAEVVREWLDAARPGRIVLVGHSSGTQTAARAAAMGTDGPNPVAGVVLASPTIAPTARPLPRTLLRWWLDGRREPPELSMVHRREWRRAGVRGNLHLLRVHLADHLEDAVPALDVPVLVLRGREDRMSPASWARRLAEAAPSGGSYQELPGAHTFPWAYPAAWSEPIRRFALDHELPQDAAPLCGRG